MKPWIVALTIVAAIAAFAIAGRAFGDGDWDRQASQVVTTQSGDTVIIERGGWHGPPFGLFFIPLIIFGAFWVLGGRRRGWYGPGPGCGTDRSQWLSEWHRNEHEKMTSGGRPDVNLNTD